MRLRLHLPAAIVAGACLGVPSAPQARAECQEADATGIYALWQGGTRIEIEFQDDDVAPLDPNLDGDGLPERYRCVGNEAWTPLTPGLNNNLANCGGVDFDIWVGTSVADADPVGILDPAKPTALFGGAGAETITGTQEGDLIHGGAGVDTLFGGDGPDRLCPGPGAGGIQVVEGQGGPDLLQGGPDPDHLYGGAGRDLLQGALLDDTLDGGAGDDVLLGGPHDDVLDGGLGTDVLHGGKGNDDLVGGAGGDVLLGQDVFDDAAIDGDLGVDTCYVDGVTDQNEVNCSTRQMQACASEMWVGTTFAGTAQLNRIDPANGSKLVDPHRVQVGVGVTAVPVDQITGLAVDPTDCGLWGLLDGGGQQHLARINPSPPPRIGYIATEAASFAPSTYVDLAFDSRGQTYLLERGADLVQWDPVAGLTTVVPGIGRCGHNALRMAWDDPDAGWLFIVTTDGAAVPTYHVDVVHPALPGFAWVATSADADYSLTVNHSMGSSGQLQEIGDGHGMWQRRRRKWERVPQMCGLTQCVADVLGAVDAIAVPHWW